MAITLVNVLLASAFDHDVAELERLANVLQYGSRFVLVTRTNKIWLRQYTDCSIALRINLASKKTDVGNYLSYQLHVTSYPDIKNEKLIL